MSERPRRTDRGVSEVLGFVLIFALITSSVGVVYVVGFDGLVGARDYERLNNAERAFDVLADNVEDITNRRAPSRATEIKLADAGLEMGDPVVVNVTGDGSNGAADFSAEYELRPIVYDADTGTRIVYSGGAVIRTEGGAGVLVGKPHFVLDDDHVVIPVIQTRATGGSDVHGSSTALIRTDHAGTELAVGTSTGTYDVTINVTTSRADVWADYFSAPAQGMDCSESTTATASCEIDGVDSVHVTAVRIDVAFE